MLRSAMMAAVIALSSIAMVLPTAAHARGFGGGGGGFGGRSFAGRGFEGRGFDRGDRRFFGGDRFSLASATAAIRIIRTTPTIRITRITRTTATAIASRMREYRNSGL